METKLFYAYFFETPKGARVSSVYAEEERRDRQARLHFRVYYKDASDALLSERVSRRTLSAKNLSEARQQLNEEVKEVKEGEVDFSLLL